MQKTSITKCNDYIKHILHAIYIPARAHTQTSTTEAIVEDKQRATDTITDDAY